jgi:photosystem II CP43 chlorophyll apoprotein
MNPYVLSRYLARAPFGQGWRISIDNMEDLLAGHYWVGILVNIAAQWHIITKPSSIITRAFTWSGEAYLSYSLSAIAFSGFHLTSSQT